VERFSGPYVVYRKVSDFLARVLSGSVESYELYLKDVSYPGAPREMHGLPADWYVYRFTMVGFERVPLDGNLYLS
jgi:hypothetical protein